MMIQFQKATKAKAKARVALIGLSGSGKTYTALRLATGLGGRVAVIDTERGSASKYSDEFNFDVLELESFSPQSYVDAVIAAVGAKYDVLVIDSLSHAWMGKDGALEQVDNATKKSQSGNKFMAWRDVTPLHNKMVDALVRAPLHIIVTMRAKTEYVIETNERGKQAPRKIGLAAIQRDGLEYEFDVVGDMDIDHNLIISKTRCRALDGKVIEKPGEQLAKTLLQWLTDGVDKNGNGSEFGATPQTETKKVTTIAVAAKSLAEQISAERYPIVVQCPEGQWDAFCADPDLAHIAGTPYSRMKIASAINACGIEEINPDNLIDVKDALKKKIAEMKANGHWAKDQKSLAAFWGAVNKELSLSGAKLTDEQVHQALGVAHLADYLGTGKEAFAAVKNWVARQALNQTTAQTEQLPTF